MFEIVLRNGKKFECDSHTTIFDAAKYAGVFLDHSCLKARCRSCRVKVISGETENIEHELVLTTQERQANYVLSCNSIPKSDLKLDVEGIFNINFFTKKILPAKIESIDKINSNILKLLLRLPPNSNFKFNAGQFINLTKGDVTRSYSISSKPQNNDKLEFFIKKYESGLMSSYLFEFAKINDLLRIEGPIGSFFLRETDKRDLIFVANGTGVAPIKSIVDNIENNYLDFSDKNIWVFIGVRNEEELLWVPNEKRNLNLKYIPVYSKPTFNWIGETGYVQHVLSKYINSFDDAQVYASGSSKMIDDLRNILLPKLLEECNFFTDYFIQTN
jgi:CDP-4-dehydro-6-deoxyglucose reductase